MIEKKPDLKNYCETLLKIATSLENEFTELGADVDLSTCLHLAQQITAANITHDVYLPTILQALERRTASGLFKP